MCLISAPATADAIGGLDNTEQELRLIEARLDELTAQMQDMAAEVKQLKRCGVLARQKPESFADFSSGLKGRMPDGLVRKMYADGVVARLDCGLPAK